MKERFITKNFRDATMDIINHANVIVKEYHEQGFSLTLRQLYYQFVARGLLENTERNYKNLGSIISDARLCGLIDWQAIEDRTRGVESRPHWDTPSDIIESAARSYGIDRWEGQEHRVEVWIEKEALTGVIEPTCRELDVKWLACRGYVSQSELWRAGKRLQGYIQEGIKPVILHLGDHDPSGIDMTRDNLERASLFAWDDVEVVRIALNMDQVRKYNPPPNPAKLTDTRCEGYMERFGKKSWELDALEPRVLTTLVEGHVNSYLDRELYDERVDLEGEHIDLLNDVSARWDDVVEFIRNG